VIVVSPAAIFLSLLLSTLDAFYLITLGEQPLYEALLRSNLIGDQVL
jgi:hypothetical protein